MNGWGWRHYRAVTSSIFSMRTILHVLTQPEDNLAAKIIEQQGMQPDCRVEVVELSALEPDYDALLDKIFAADSVAVW
jgi:hypothetical protein